MKNIYLIRHSKAGGKSSPIKDIDRPLNQRGLEDGRRVARVFNERFSELPSFVLCSPSKRTQMTLQLFLEHAAWEDPQVIFPDSLYLASAEEIRDIICKETPKRVSTIALFGHNPGLTEVAFDVPELQLDNLPTTGILALQYSGDWRDFRWSDSKFKDLVTPKLL